MGLHGLALTMPSLTFLFSLAHCAHMYAICMYVYIMFVDHSCPVHTLIRFNDVPPVLFLQLYCAVQYSTPVVNPCLFSYPLIHPPNTDKDKFFLLFFHSFPISLLFKIILPSPLIHHHHPLNSPTPTHPYSYTHTHPYTSSSFTLTYPTAPPPLPLLNQLLPQ